MEIHHLNAALIQKSFLAGAAELDSKKEWINELNVFPVPDGDTGTNMTLTIMTAAKEVAAMEEPDLPALCKAISSGTLRGARGNSGVILSQLLRGFTKEIESAPNGEISIPLFAAALVRASETAYKAVMKPKEGTILTVARAMSEKGSELAAESTELLPFIEAVISAGDEALEKTPELLPVLKQAGVVDSGGQGLMTVVKGAFQGLIGKKPEFDFHAPQQSSSGTAPRSIDTSELDTADIRFGYCTEFIVNLEKAISPDQEQEFKSFLESIGDSIVCVSSDELIKVHVHTNDPGLAIQKGLSYGPLSRMKIDNMREEHNERLIKNASQIAAAEQAKAEAPQNTEKKKYGFISVSVGDGLDSIFSDIGVDLIISGGQTMNPSTEDILNALEKVNAETVFVLPNNKNIILAAEQARDLREDKQVIVVPTKNIPQGITALISFMPDNSAEENLSAMTEACAQLKSAEITYAVRNTMIDGFEIHEGDFMAIGDSGMLEVNKELRSTVFSAIEKMAEDDAELITLYYGSEVQREDAEELAEAVAARFPDAELELNYGGQPVYYYFVSVE